MPKQYSGLGRDTGGANQPQVNDIDLFGSHLDEDERTEWMQDYLGVDESEARTMQDAINHFTYDYEDIHWGRDEYRNDLIDRVLEHPNAPVYSGEQYRGLHFDAVDMPKGVTPRQAIEKILKSGVWKEEGATSFSASHHVAADNFASVNHSMNNGVDRIAMVITYKGRTGMPIKHMSDFASENEVLHSRKQMTKGYDIVDYNWRSDGGAVFVTIADRKRK